LLDYSILEHPEMSDTPLIEILLASIIAVAALAIIYTLLRFRVGVTISMSVMVGLAAVLFTVMIYEGVFK
jgi:hypothetical protein